MENNHSRHLTHIRRVTIGMMVVAVGLTLFAYQADHHGLWGRYVNYNKSPKINLAGSRIMDGDLIVNIYRPNGPETYGSFIVRMVLSLPKTDQIIEVWNPHELADIPRDSISNTYAFQKVTLGPWGLVVPLAAKADVTLPLDRMARLALAKDANAIVTVDDVSGLSWSASIPVS